MGMAQALITKQIIPTEKHLPKQHLWQMSEQIMKLQKVELQHQESRGNQREFDRRSSRIELSENETEKLMKLLDQAAAIMPYEDVIPLE